MSKELKAIKKIIDDEFNSSLKKIEGKVTPILEQEFAKVQKKYPGLQAILVGNGAWCYKFKEGSKEESRFDDLYKSQYPKAFHKLNELMDACYVFEGNFNLVSDISCKKEPRPKGKS